jgi:hypothetical protein
MLNKNKSRYIFAAIVKQQSLLLLETLEVKRSYFSFVSCWFTLFLRGANESGSVVLQLPAYPKQTHLPPTRFPPPSVYFIPVSCLANSSVTTIEALGRVQICCVSPLCIIPVLIDAT